VAGWGCGVAGWGVGGGGVGGGGANVEGDGVAGGVCGWDLLDHLDRLWGYSHRGAISLVKLNFHVT
jgi:hypothetical protein